MRTGEYLISNLLCIFFDDDLIILYLISIRKDEGNLGNIRKSLIEGF